MRTALLVLAAASLAACNYGEQKADIFLTVDNIPPAANRLSVTLTDSSNTPHTYAPAFGAGAQTSLDLAFAAPWASTAAGVFHIAVDAIQSDSKTDVVLASGSVDGTPQSTAPLHVTLRVPSGQAGNFGQPCAPVTATSTACVGTYNCMLYRPNDAASGICTQPCGTAADCQPGAVSPAAVCEAFPGTTTKYCQWSCAGGTACPQGLTCDAASAGKQYCGGN